MVANGTEFDDIAGIGNEGWAEGPRTTAERSAQLLFQDPQSPVDFEARDENEARRAVEEFARLFEAAPQPWHRQRHGTAACSHYSTRRGTHPASWHTTTRKDNRCGAEDPGGPGGPGTCAPAAALRSTR